MPSRHRGKSRRRMRGRGKLMNFIRKAASKSTKSSAGLLTGSLGSFRLNTRIASNVGKAAGAVGYGRRRRFGRGLRLAGM